MRRRTMKKCGTAAICLGVFIILAMVMPAGFWMITLGIILILTGVMIRRR